MDHITPISIRKKLQIYMNEKKSRRDLNLHKNYMAMKSTWNRTCFPNPPGCCMYWLPYEQVGPDIKESRWIVFILSVSWNWHLHTASGQHALILFISHSRGDRYRQCLCLEQSKIRQTSSGRVVLLYNIFMLWFLWPLCIGWLLALGLYKEDYLQMF